MKKKKWALISITDRSTYGEECIRHSSRNFVSYASVAASLKDFTDGRAYLHDGMQISYNRERHMPECRFAGETDGIKEFVPDENEIQKAKLIFPKEQWTVTGGEKKRRMYKMKKIILILISLSFAISCLANGRCEKLEKEILKNPNVLSVDVGQIDKWTEEIYFAHIILSNGILLEVREFNRNLSGKMISVERIGDCEFPYCTYAMKVPDKHGLNSAYLYTSIKTFQLSCLLKKKIITVDDIINNSDEIYAFAEMLSRESPEERTIRRNLGTTQNDPNFTGKLGNFETDEYWGQVFARAYSEDFWNTNPGDYWEGMFLDE